MNNRDIPIPSSQDAFVLVVYGNPPYAGRINISSGIKSFFFSIFFLQSDNSVLKKQSYSFLSI